MTVPYKIKQGEFFGFLSGGDTANGTLKAYDEGRNIGLIYFPKDKDGCGCYIMATKHKDGFFEQYSEDTWVNVE